MSQGNVAEAFLRGLKNLGVDYIFANPGSEFIPLIEAYSRLKPEEVPRAVTVPHEALAVAMAHGYYLKSGKPQAVMAHVNVGTANALIGIISASRMNVPLFFVAGRTPLSDADLEGCRDRFVHWAQESYDQGAMCREYVKWDYELKIADNLGSVLERGWSLMQASPPGPVNLMIPREVLNRPATSEVPSRPAVVEAPAPQPQAMLQLGEWLHDSRRAVIITSRSGTDASSVAHLAECAEKHALSVVCPQAQAMNLPVGHSHFLGFENSAALSEADLIVVLDTDVPWLPAAQKIAPGARVVHAGPDPLFSRLPMRHFRSDLNITASATGFLTALSTLPARGTETRSAWISGRREEYVSRRNRRREETLASSHLSGDVLAQILSSVLEPDVVLLNELSLPPELLDLKHAGGYFRSGSASGLGWAMGCAAGIKMADPKSVPICVVGDGVYYLSNPLAAHWIARSQNAPFLTIVMNNEGMQSIHKQKTFTDLAPSLAFAEIAKAMGAFGATVETPQQFKEALAVGLEQVRAGNQGVIDVRLPN